MPSLLSLKPINRVTVPPKLFTTPRAASAWPEAQRRKVECAGMDTGAGDKAATPAKPPQCRIVHDKFHVSKMVTQAVDKNRREEAKPLEEPNDETPNGRRYLWLHGMMMAVPVPLTFICSRLVAVPTVVTFFGEGKGPHAPADPGGRRQGWPVEFLRATAKPASSGWAALSGAAFPGVWAARGGPAGQTAERTR